VLIPHCKHTAADLLAWAEYEAADLVHADRISRKVERSVEEITGFVAKHPGCYASVSWGKDSTVLADMCERAGVPLVWIREEPIFNPDCLLVRDEFLALRQDCKYEEIRVHCRYGDGTWHATGTLESGFRQARERYGPHYLLGIRREESGQRAIRFMVHGLTSLHACAPLGYWTVADVFAYLAVNRLPVHPVYGMLGGERWRREHLRVCSLGGQRGSQMGRAEHEDEYYGDVLARLKHKR
jgi:phosphoadenosine phosphosulfate reductase